MRVALGDAVPLALPVPVRVGVSVDDPVLDSVAAELPDAVNEPVGLELTVLVREDV